MDWLIVCRYEDSSAYCLRRVWLDEQNGKPRMTQTKNTLLALRLAGLTLFGCDEV